jgi:hypothetical protein
MNELREIQHQVDMVENAVVNDAKGFALEEIELLRQLLKTYILNKDIQS